MRTDTGPVWPLSGCPTLRRSSPEVGPFRRKDRGLRPMCPLTSLRAASCDGTSGAANSGPSVLLGRSRVTLSRLWCYAGIRQVLPGSQSRRRPEIHRRGQPLQSEARSAKNVPESAICGVLPNRPTPTGSVLWLVPISNPRSAPRRVGRTNLRSDALRLWRSPPPCGSCKK